MYCLYNSQQCSWEANKSPLTAKNVIAKGSIPSFTLKNVLSEQNLEKHFPVQLLGRETEA